MFISLEYLSKFKNHIFLIILSYEKNHGDKMKKKILCTMIHLHKTIHKKIVFLILI